MKEQVPVSQTVSGDGAALHLPELVTWAVASCPQVKARFPPHVPEVWSGAVLLFLKTPSASLPVSLLCDRAMELAPGEPCMKRESLSGEWGI